MGDRLLPAQELCDPQQEENKAKATTPIILGKCDMVYPVKITDWCCPGHFPYIEENRTLADNLAFLFYLELLV
jgi:hypothetical protein